jgi:hypothetical protein
MPHQSPTPDESTDIETCRPILETTTEIYVMQNSEEYPISSVQSGILPESCTASTIHDSEYPELTALFPSSFMKAHTKFEDWRECSQAAPSDLSSWEDLAKISKQQVAGFITRTTEFDEVSSFFQAAAQSHIDTN